MKIQGRSLPPCRRPWLWRRFSKIIITSSKNVTKITSQNFPILGPHFQSKFLSYTPVNCCQHTAEHLILIGAMQIMWNTFVMKIYTL